MITYKFEDKLGLRMADRLQASYEQMFLQIRFQIPVIVQYHNSIAKYRGYTPKLLSLYLSETH